MSYIYFLYEKQDRDYLCEWKRVSIPFYIFFLALLHGGSVPIIVGTMNNYVNFLFEIKTQPVSYSVRNDSHFAKTGYNHHKYIDLVTDGCIIIRQSYGLPYNDLLV